MALNGNTNEEKIWNYLYSLIKNSYGVAGLMGNLKAESALNPINLQNSGNKKLNLTDEQYTISVDNGIYTNFVKDSIGYGLAQWTYWNRKQNLFNYAKSKGVSIGDLEMQLDFLITQELQKSYKSVWNSILVAKSVREASDIVLTQFEKPANQSDSVKLTRASYGQVYYDKYEKKKVEGNTISARNVHTVIDLALNEVGYLEKKSNSQLDDKTANAGSANYTKYGRDMHNLYPSVMDFPASWCDAFVDWCFYKAYGVCNAKGLLGGDFNDYTPSSAQLYKNKNVWYTSNPKMGDQIFFKNDTRICHTGLVYDVDSKYVYTIEGNTSGASGVIANGGGVCKKKYPLTYSNIAGYGRPKYDNVEYSPTPTIKNIVKVNTTLNIRNKPNGIKIGSLKNGEEVEIFDYQNGWFKIGIDKWVSSDYIHNTYGRVTASVLNMRSGAGTNYKDIGDLKQNTNIRLLGESNGWYMVLHEKKLGWVSSKYIDIL